MGVGDQYTYVGLRWSGTTKRFRIHKSGPTPSVSEIQLDYLPDRNTLASGCDGGGARQEDFDLTTRRVSA